MLAGRKAGIRNNLEWVYGISLNANFFETYAPIVNWQTVRTMLVMSLLLQLSTKQVHYTAAFMPCTRTLTKTQNGAQ
jgi:hypothetical protein